MPAGPWHSWKPIESPPKEPVILEAVRDIAIDEPHNWLGRAVAKGEVFFVFDGVDYGCVNTNGGIGVSEHGPHDYPVYELPSAALEVKDE